jgi:hypothetical protein
MSLPSLSSVLYPLALVAGNAAAGIGLYVLGAIFFALVLWLNAVLVVAGLFAALGGALARVSTPA